MRLNFERIYTCKVVFMPHAFLPFLAPTVEPEPAAAKPGQCPVSEDAGFGFGICFQECDDDSGCADEMKCCANGCGRTCKAPISNANFFCC